MRSGRLVRQREKQPRLEGVCQEGPWVQVLVWPLRLLSHLLSWKKESGVILLRLLFLLNFFIPLSSPHPLCWLLSTTARPNPGTQFSEGPPRSHPNVSWRYCRLPVWGSVCFKTFIIKENSLSWNWTCVLFLHSPRSILACIPLQPLLVWGPAQGGCTSRHHSLSECTAKGVCWDGSHLRGASGPSWAPFSWESVFKSFGFVHCV